MPGWNQPTTNAKTFADLPKEAQDYVEYIEKFIGVKVCMQRLGERGTQVGKLFILYNTNNEQIKWIGTGPDREAMIKRA